MQELAPGDQLGAYHVLSIIGRGGMGVVYLAEHASLERRVALKVLAPQFSADPNFRTRFERESRLAASLDHPNVVPVYEAGEIDGVLFIAMRYVDGPDLRTVLDREGHFEVARAIGIAAQLASALDAAHAHGLIHRDVKPGNVLLAAGYGSDGGEHVYLTDFGLTKRSASKSGLTQLGQLVGTIDYIAPEQITGGTVDGRVDIYALGCVFFEMLSGKAPFLRETDLATMAAHLHEPPPSLTALRPDLPAASDALIARVLAKDPDQRFSSAAQFVRAARVALAPGAQSAASPSAGGGRTDPTVIVPIATAGQQAPRSPTVLADTNVPPVSAGATVAQPSPPSPTPPPVVAAGSPPTTAPPPDSGPFASGGSVPPYVPAGAQPYPSPPPSNRSIPPIAILAVLGLAILLVAGAALAIGGAPHATPTLIAQVSPSLPALPSAVPTALPTALATALATPTAVPTLAPTATAQATPSATIEPTIPASAQPTPAGSPVISDRDLLFADDMSDASSGWSLLNEDFVSVGYDTGALAFRFNSSPAWALSSRQLDAPQTTLVSIGEFLPQSAGYFGPMCGDSSADKYYGAVVGTDGSLVFISITGNKATVLASQDKLKLSAPVGSTTLIALECSTTSSGDLSMIVELADTGPVALYVDHSGGPPLFDAAALYGEADSNGYTMAVNAAAVYGVGGSDGTMSAGAQQVVSHIPTDFQQNCHESPLFNDAATYVVTCIPQTSGTGAEIEQYRQFASKPEMDAAYQDLVGAFGVESTGTCQSGPNETNWTISGTTFGRVQCAPQFAGIRFDWTDDTTSILSSLIDFQGSYSATYTKWLNAGPV